MLFLSTGAWAKEVLGYLPLHSGYAFLGYLGAGNLHATLLKYNIYTVVVMIGFLATILDGVKKGNFSYFTTYFVIVLCLIALFMRPENISIGEVASVADQKMPQNIVTSAEETIKQKTKATVAAPPIGLYHITQLTDKLVNTINNAIDITTSPEGFLNDPAYSYLYARMLAENINIEDPVLNADLQKFIAGPYSTALIKYKKENPKSKEDTSWPGSKVLLGKYSSEEQKEWNDLFERLYQEGRKSGMVTVWSKLFRKKEVASNASRTVRIMAGLTGEDKELVARELVFKSEIDPTSQMYGGIEKARGGNPILSGIKEAAVWLVSSWRSAWLSSVLQLYPLMQSIFLYIALTLFPFILLMALLPFPGQQVNILFTYFISIFWIKSWLWGTTISANFASIGWTNIPDIVEKVIPYATGLIILLTPIFTFMLLFKGSMAGVAMISGIVGGVAAGASGAAGGAAKMGTGAAAGGMAASAATRQTTMAEITREKAIMQNLKPESTMSEYDRKQMSHYAG